MGNIFNKKNCIVSNDWTLYKTSANPEKPNCHRLFASDQGYNRGVIQWKLKFSKSTSSAYGGREGAIGICSEMDTNKIQNERPWINDSCLKDRIFWCRNGQNIDVANGSNLSLGRRFNHGDTVTVILNCEEWYIQFLLNDKVLKAYNKEKTLAKVEIPKNKTYFPIF